MMKQCTKVILAVCESDSHTVANQLIQWTLENEGYHVSNLGAFISVRDIYKELESQQKVLAILVGSLNGHAVNDLRQLEFYKKKYPDVPVIFGGNLSVSLIEKEKSMKKLYDLGVDFILDSIDEILPALENLKYKEETLNLETSCN